METGILLRLQALVLQLSVQLTILLLTLTHQTLEQLHRWSWAYTLKMAIHQLLQQIQMEPQPQRF